MPHRRIIDRRETLLKQLFVLMNHSDSNEAVMDVDLDAAKVNPDKLKEFLDNNKLGYMDVDVDANKVNPDKLKEFLDNNKLGYMDVDVDASKVNQDKLKAFLDNNKLGQEPLLSTPPHTTHETVPPKLKLNTNLSIPCHPLDTTDSPVATPPVELEGDHAELANGGAGSPSGSDDSQKHGSQSAETSPTRKHKRVLPPPERMVTRGVSGAIRHKSVDEIISERSAGIHPSSTRTSPATTPTIEKPKYPMIRMTAKRPPQRTITPPSRRMDSKHYYAQTYGGHKYPEAPREHSKAVDLYAWHMRIHKQPLYKVLQTAGKVLSTRDWKIARDELKLLRAMQRIETLKANHAWGFKQLKRHKAVPRTKTHWDQLLDEMKWMQTDFKEERRWKIATAYEVARWVMEWHEADDKQNVCVRRRSPSPRIFHPEDEMMDLEQDQVEGDAPISKDVDEMEDISLTVTAEASSATSHEPELKVEEPETPVDFSSVIKSDAMFGLASKEPVVKAEPQLESTDAFKPLKLRSQSDNELIDAMAIDGLEESKTTLKLKGKAVMPSDMLSMPPPVSPNLIHQYRSAIVDLQSDKTIFMLTAMADVMLLDPQSLFPDLPMYEPPKPEDNDAYWDEVEFGRVVPITKFIARKAVRREEPAIAGKKRRRPEDWDDGNMDAEEERLRDEPVKPLASFMRYDTAPLISPIFAPKKSKDLPGLQIPQPAPPNPALQRTPLNWTEEDDNLLTSLIRPFQYNWDLICDSMNSIRAPITGEHRVSWDCFERYKQKESTTTPTAASAPGSSSTSTSQPTTPVTPVRPLPLGLGNLPNNLLNASSNLSTPPSPTVASAALALQARQKKDSLKKAMPRVESMRRKQRQYSIFEAIKKTQKKREHAQKPSVAAPAPKSTIEAHGTSSTGQRLPSPMELSMMKHQRERQIAQALMEQQRQNMAAYALSGAQANSPIARPPHPGAIPMTHPLVQQVRPPQAAIGRGIPVASPQNKPMVRPPGAPGQQSAPGIQAQQPGQLPINRLSPAATRTLPPEQLQAALMMRQQQQMAMLAAAAAGGRPPVSAPLQRFGVTVSGGQPSG
ncbi:hypothetical protein BC936DRAFT_139874 [Jimgerdemannia flammicorona]|uniref:Vacuolar import and degradation protein 21 n=1 Tax=Jimgerdemannia flammicorona TaxID=994334 RepID=A0A433B910_9FUNG|nr:hypothetical protein BC936DRAFT_139874 [Jimgerdemannia flammicorona]